MMEASHRGTRFRHNQSLHLIGININECFDSLGLGLGLGELTGRF